MFCWKKIPVVLKDFLKALFPRTFPGLNIIFDYFPGFQDFSSLCGDPEREASSISRGQALCFHGLIFLLSIVLSTKSERLTNPSDVLTLKVFRLDANKINMKLYKNIHHLKTPDLSMKMTFFHLLTVAVVPSCGAYIKGEASFSFWETKFPWLRFPLYQIFSWATQEKKIEHTFTGDCIIYFTFSLRFHFFLQ